MGASKDEVVRDAEQDLLEARQWLRTAYDTGTSHLETLGGDADGQDVWFAEYREAYERAREAFDAVADAFEEPENDYVHGAKTPLQERYDGAEEPEDWRVGSDDDYRPLETLEENFAALQDYLTVVEAQHAAILDVRTAYADAAGMDDHEELFHGDREALSATDIGGEPRSPDWTMEDLEDEYGDGYTEQYTEEELRAVLEDDARDEEAGRVADA